MRFSHKVLLMPAFAGISFVAVLCINELTGTRNSALIETIQTEYLPALELRRDIETSLVEVQRALQDAVSAEDVEALLRADVLSARLAAQLDSGQANPAFQPGEIALLKVAYAGYYDGARATTERLLRTDRGAALSDDALQPALVQMATQYARLRKDLEIATVRQRTAVDAAFDQARANHRRSVRTMTLALVLGLCGVGIASRVLIRSTLGSLREAVARAAALSVRGGKSERVHSGDEIEELLGSMNGMLAALAGSERQLNEAQRLAHVGSWHWDLALAAGGWSEELQRILGREGPPPASIEGCLALVDPADRERVKAEIGAVLVTRAPFRQQVRIVRPDGEQRTLLVHGEVLVAATGALVGLRGAAQDATDTERAAAALRESEERYRTLFENNPQPMWLYDVHNLRFLAVNAAAVAHYGYSHEEFLALTTADISAGDVPDAIDPVDHGPAGVSSHRRKDGSLIEVELSAHSVPFGTGRARLVLATDVTERRQLEQQLRQSQKMQAIGRLAGGIAHDFNNLLNVIMGYADIVLRRLPAGDPLLPKVSEISKAADRAAGLTRQLLAFSRKQVLQPRAVDLNAVVVDMSEMLRRLIGEDVEFRTQLEQALGPALVDRGQVEQVIMNLAVNARDAMPGNGTLVIETRNVELDGSYGRSHPDMQPGQYVRLSISDTGRGMDRATLSRIFEPFFTTKAQGEGTGLGLSTVYGIVEQSGGFIDARSEPGQGSTFTVYLPRLPGPPVAVAAPVVPDQTPVGSETILLVEDEDALRGMIREVLEQSGYHVLEGATPGQALDASAAYDGTIHLVLTDVVMPEMNGRDLAERVKLQRPGVVVVFMSGYTDDAIGQHGLLDSATHFLQKPFTSDRLLHKLREALSAAGVGDSAVSGAYTAAS
jgi:two-component system, cell cycle sensor histidine kinase and response regulator CckA